jgi:Tol biopolymer transport system component
VGARRDSGSIDTSPGADSPPEDTTVSPNMKITRLTVNGKTENAAISTRRKKRLFYVLKDGGQESLWIRQVATNSNVQIVPPAPVNIGRETFSPDGTYVYYHAFEKDIHRAPCSRSRAIGRRCREKFYSNIASVIALSPDGIRIAFTRNDNAATGEDHLIGGERRWFERAQAGRP